MMVLSSHHYDALKGNYKPQGEDNCVVHSLHSSAFPHIPVYPQLPQPAILDSIPAAGQLFFIIYTSVIDERIFTHKALSAIIDMQHFKLKPNC